MDNPPTSSGPKLNIMHCQIVISLPKVLTCICGSLQCTRVLPASYDSCFEPEPCTMGYVNLIVYIITQFAESALIKMAIFGEN